MISNRDISFRQLEKVSFDRRPRNVKPKYRLNLRSKNMSRVGKIKNFYETRFLVFSIEKMQRGGGNEPVDHKI